MFRILPGDERDNRLIVYALGPVIKPEVILVKKTKQEITNEVNRAALAAYQQLGEQPRLKVPPSAGFDSTTVRIPPKQVSPPWEKPRLSEEFKRKVVSGEFVNLPSPWEKTEWDGSVFQVVEAVIWYSMQENPSKPGVYSVRRMLDSSPKVLSGFARWDGRKWFDWSLHKDKAETTDLDAGWGFMAHFEWSTSKVVWHPITEAPNEIGVYKICIDRNARKVFKHSYWNEIFWCRLRNDPREASRIQIQSLELYHPPVSNNYSWCKA